MWNNKISAIAIHSYYLQIRNIVYRQFHEKLLISQNKNFIFIRLWGGVFHRKFPIGMRTAADVYENRAFRVALTGHTKSQPKKITLA